MNYKALNTDFTDEELKLTWKEWIWDKCPYWFRNFIRKFRRWWKYTGHLWKENPWNEEYEFIEIVRLQLEIMAKEFENNQITVSAPWDAKRMRLASELLRRYTTSYYWDKYREEAHDPELEKKQNELWNKEGWEAAFNFNTYKEGYDFKYVMKGEEKDLQALKLAFKIISKELPGWWQ